MSQFTTSQDEDSGTAAKAGAAAQEASATAKTAGHAAQEVAQSGAHEAAAVAGEAKARIGDLVSQSGRELSDQAATQQKRLADGLGSLGEDFTRMADADEGGGIAGEVVRRAAEHASTVGSWLADRDPQQLVKDVTAFARRRPGTFIAVAAIAGVVVGRLSRAIAAGAASDDSGASAPATLGGPRYADADAAVRASDDGADRLEGYVPPVGVVDATPIVPVVDGTRPTEPVGDGTGLTADVDDPPLYTESAARLDGAREGGSDDRPDTL
ncbi:hypothetical protein [Microbacterium sp. NPDC089188]|uniref:hypothetical protein n=1 Tax=Microbacterium sp. NPDC089188 TaxID=3154971 RepID=UPI00343B08FD